MKAMSLTDRRNASVRSGGNGPAGDTPQLDDAVVKPVKGKRSPTIESLVVLVGTTGDLESLVRSAAFKSVHPQPLYNSRLYVDKGQPSLAAFIGPIIGAPYAAMLMETLIAWGARQFLFLGWCGAISPNVKIGDLLIPTAAIIDEGTSGHYPTAALPLTASHPAKPAVERIRHHFSAREPRPHLGAVWTTDAIFRETPAKIRHYREKGALAVDMETSALFTVAEYRGVEIGSILVVSDELSSLKWMPGFKTAAFSSGRAHAYEVIRRLCPAMPTHGSDRGSPS